MTVQPGTRFGPYEIVSPLGAGGMGEVYKARDTRLDRSVAIKILPPAMSEDEELRLRLQREAKAISQLADPHICALYDVGEGFIVMELLQGETLASRIARGPLPMADVLRFGAEIATALHRAHGSGLVHRDLKPGNVMITRQGAKLLDFGLAKPAGISIGRDDKTMSVQANLTAEGVIVGTLQYMAPEQLDGAATDGRTDIFALGAVLYEMATGRRAFGGSTQTSIIASIMTASPPPLALEGVAPPQFEHVVMKCLTKDREERWQSAYDVAEQLRWIAENPAVEVSAAAPPRARSLWLITVALLSLILAGVATGLYLSERRRPPQPLAMTVNPPYGFTFYAQALSPDGRTVVVAGWNPETAKRMMWLRSTGDLELKPLREITAPGWPFWSADGKWIAYYDSDGLMRIPAAGGEPELVTRMPPGTGGAWNQEGTVIVAHFGLPLRRISSDGGKLTPLTTLDAGRKETFHGWPQFLADGEHFLFLVRKTPSEEHEIHAGSLEKGRLKLVTAADSLIGVARSSLYFVRDGAIYAQPFDSKKLEVHGKPSRIAGGVLYLEEWAHAFASVAPDGGLTYLPDSSALSERDLVWRDRKGNRLDVPLSGFSFTELALAPADGKVALSKRDSAKGADDIYHADLARSVVSKITGGRSNHVSVVWSPAGDRLYFASDRTGYYDVYEQLEDGTPGRAIWSTRDDKYPHSITPDGSALIVSRQPGQGANVDIWLVPLRGGQPRPLIASDSFEFRGVLSPDGRWLAYMSERSGRTEVYLRPFPEGRAVQISTAGGVNPSWSFDGKEIFYAGENDMLTSVSVDATGNPGKPQPLFQLGVEVRAWAPSRTRDAFLMILTRHPGKEVTRLHYMGAGSHLGSDPR